MGKLFSVSQVSTAADKSPSATIITGGPGVGKTFLLSTIDGIFIIPVEDGMKGASPHHNPAKFMDEHGRCILPATFPELMEALDTFIEANRPVEQGGKRSRPYRHLGLDSLTGIETLVHNAACGAEKVLHMEAKEYKAIWCACRPYWVGLQRKLTEIRRSGVNIWIIAHADEDFDASETTGEVYRKSDIALAGTGKTLAEIRRMWRGWADNVFYLQKTVRVTKGDKTKRAMASFGGRILITQETARCMAKSRLTLPPSIPATWPDLREAMRNAVPAPPEKLTAQIQELMPSLTHDERKAITEDLGKAKGSATALSAVLSRAQSMAEVRREDASEPETTEEKGGQAESKDNWNSKYPALSTLPLPDAAMEYDRLRASAATEAIDAIQTEWARRLRYEAGKVKDDPEASQDIADLVSRAGFAKGSDAAKIAAG